MNKMYPNENYPKYVTQMNKKYPNENYPKYLTKLLVSTYE